MDISDSELDFTPPDIAEKAKKATLDLLPEKSRRKYEIQYDIFVNWCRSNKIKKYTENALLVYFTEKAKSLQSSTLWSIYSMLKATLSVKHDIDISPFKKLIAFLKKTSVGYRAKKSRTLSREDINKFLVTAPNETYLMMKVSNIHNNKCC